MATPNMTEQAKLTIKPRRKPVGRVGPPAGMFALLSVLLALVFERIGVLAVADSWINGVFVRNGFELVPVSLPVVWGTLSVTAFGLSWAILDSPQLWRRVALGLAAGVITAAWAPVLATLGYEFPVVPLLVGLAWAWFCATVYAQQHRMPCDALPAAPAQPASTKS